MIAGLIIVGLASHSLGVLAAGGDYVADSIAIVLGLLAIRISKHPHGHPKATSFVALINSTLLLLASVIVIIEATRRLSHYTPDIHGLSAMIVSIVATLAMIAGALILKGDENDGDLHMRSVMLDTLADAVSSAAVAVTGAIIFATGRFFWSDSAVAAVIGIVISYHAIKLMRTVIADLKRPSEALIK